MKKEILDAHVQQPDLGIRTQAKRKRLLHIGVHDSANRNAGDTLLFPVVRRAFDVCIGPFDWELRQAWDALDAEEASRLNEVYDGIVIGGGGLLLRDQDGADVSRSGWQWNSSVAAVDALDLPLIIYAIGYNRFRGQPDFEPVFTDHIQAVARQSAFFGLRNTGSINAIAAYLPGESAVSLRRQFCPTTVLWQLYPQYQKQASTHDEKGHRVLAFNVAFDRAAYRFGAEEQVLLGRLADCMMSAQRQGWQIVVVAHKSADRGIEQYLSAAGVSYETRDLTDASPDEVLSFYAEVDAAVGMRGHAQMIPFGLRRPIFSIISHDKMRYFLEDIDQPTWGGEIGSPDFEQRLSSFLERLENNRALVHEEVGIAQDLIWQETRRNFDVIGKMIKG
ncbi:polysaccharide pyruvyl transferase family protein [Corticimicrobacter populi]|uniref:Polysaccharide pyruvyl transferase domain-containing protein n=1 Tax=Corticimicrobacter populi TaxID=2175229 RepID=A0A2V1JYT6_9BURK|nr:polysaccharide pyruvyl transferase family protein [Corticimicrobacter populi]PWF21225.1 hypothetical protein DD235_15515 [Corticimicrobacter populi]